MRKKRKYSANIHHLFKGHQHKSNLMVYKVHDDDVEMSCISWADHRLNRKRRTRVGILESVKPRVR